MGLYLKVFYADKTRNFFRTAFFETNIENKNFDYKQGIELDNIAFSNAMEDEDVMSWKLVDEDKIGRR